MTSGRRCCIMNAEAHFSVVVLGVAEGDELFCYTLNALLQVCHRAENNKQIFFMTEGPYRQMYVNHIYNVSY